MASSGKQQVAEQGSRIPTTTRDFFFSDPFYQTGWQDFDKVKSAMMKESRDLWKKMDQDFRKMRCMRDNIMLEGGEKEDTTVATPGALQQYEDSWMFPRRHMVPFFGQDLAATDLFKEKDHEVIRVKDDEKQLEVSLDTSHYRPDELHVRYSNGVLTIDGKHEEKSDDGLHVVQRAFTRSYTVPSNPEHITSDLSSDGVLVVKAEKCNPAGEIAIQKK